MTAAPDTFGGPRCPRCDEPVPLAFTRPGIIDCAHCGEDFEATIFNPPERHAQRAQLVDAGPESTSACANHARNAATTSCQRCGLFICALCEMNVGSGSYCPSCFERVRTEGALNAAVRYRDYGTLAWLAVIVGALTFFLVIPGGALAIYYAVRAFPQRRMHGRPIAGAVLALIAGLLEVLGGIALIALIVYAAYR